MKNHKPEKPYIIAKTWKQFDSNTVKLEKFWKKQWYIYVVCGGKLPTKEGVL